ncbi:hypothetical protein L910_1780 [Vibrio fluvialis PG41]|uniref:Uncharacterized protein n=1 Tax=Vibrio fluvialis PG41 TaxID=1336752 RepID=S7HY09_VIBFL|nr:hypothetical protein L910_1780 [Vibrio fluvialis PG41]
MKICVNTLFLCRFLLNKTFLETLLCTIHEVKVMILKTKTLQKQTKE